MKIDTDLRAAIRSAYQAQKHSGQDWAAKCAAQKSAIEELLKRKPLLAKRIQGAKAAIARFNIALAEASQVISALGITDDLGRIHDEERFVKAGGHFKFPEKKRWSFDEVMAELAAADAKKGAKILVRCGINWS